MGGEGRSGTREMRGYDRTSCGLKAAAQPSSKRASTRPSEATVIVSIFASWSRTSSTRSIALSNFFGFLPLVERKCLRGLSPSKAPRI